TMTFEGELTSAFYPSDFILPRVAPFFNLLLKSNLTGSIMGSWYIQSQGMVWSDMVIEILVFQPGSHGILNIAGQVIFQSFGLIGTVEAFYLALRPGLVWADMHWQNAMFHQPDLQTTQATALCRSPGVTIVT